MKKLMIAAAGAVAIGFSAVAADWFNGGITEGWPNAAGMNGVWSNTDKTTYSDSKLEVAAEVGTPLTFTANQTNALDNVKSATIASTIKFTAFPADELPAIPDGSKGGVIAVKDGATITWYVLAADTEADPMTNMWYNTKIATGDLDAAKEISIKLQPNSEYEEQYSAMYTLAGESFSEVLVVLDDLNVSTACYAGDGEVSALTGTYEAETGVIFTIADVANATKEVEGATLVEDNTYTAAAGAAITVTYTADEGYFFKGGSKTSVVEATAAQDITVTTETEREPGAAKIDDTYYYTLDAAIDAAGEEDTVYVNKNIDRTTTINIEKDVELNLNGYTIKMLDTEKSLGYLINVKADCTLVLYDAVGNGVLQNNGVYGENDVTTLVDVNGTFKMWGGTLKSNYACVKTDDNGGVGVFEMLNSDATIEITNTESFKGYTGKRFAVMSWGTATIEAGTIKGNVEACSYNGRAGTLIINGGEFDPAYAYLFCWDEAATTTYKPTLKIANTIDTLTVAIDPWKTFTSDTLEIVSGTEEGYNTYTVTKVLPTVSVTQFEEEDVPADLDAAFAYTLSSKGKGYDDWNVDYFVSFDKAIPADSVTLKGQYGLLEWQGKTLPAMTAGEEIALVYAFEKWTINVAQLATIGTFNCGVFNDYQVTDGTKMTVTLKMWKGATAITIGEPKVYDLVKKDPPLAEVQLTIDAENATVNGIEEGTVVEGSNLVFTVTADDTYTVTNVTANGETLTPVEDTYTYTVGKTDVAIVVLTKKNVVPVVPAEQGEAELDKETGNIVITPAEEVTHLDVNVPVGFTGKYVIPSTVDSITGVEIGNLVINKETEGGSTIDIASVCKIEDGNIVLDADKATPEVDTTVEEPLVVTDETVTIAVKAVPGLTYALQKSATVDGTYETIAETKADAETASITLEAAKTADPAAFYKIEVTK